ncbi:ABC transporter substrate-binding protein [Streptomyces sp. AC495_CC817]|uniref:ABC transporter substrate-binding protein n=1 Tax=Streptomyces sp. AC495_CC817 TaxID=2823900 RepID=UPI001C268D60|nr:ABC transporter substrate-binding protein [Streptomyces sp. AC495_CC817]
MTPRTRTIRLLAAVSAGAGALALTACGTSVSSGAAPAAEHEAVTIENCGRTVEIDATPTAVVGLHPSQTELLLRLGLADALVGQAQTAAQELPADVIDLAADVPVIGGATPPSREELLSVGPDFVYSPTTYEFTAEQGFASIEQLDQAGVAAYTATGGCFDRRMEGTVDDLFVDLQNLGDIFHVEDEADALIASSQAELDAVEEAIDGLDRPRVAQVFVEGTTLTAIGAGVEYDILRRAGADTVFTPDDPAFSDFFAAEITPESLAAEAPDALVFAVSDPAHEQAVRAYLASTFPDMPAVRDGRLIAVSATDMFPGTLGNVSVVRQIAEALYPEADFG